MSECMYCINYLNMINWVSSLEWFNALLGGVVGLLLVFCYDWTRRPRIKMCGFRCFDTNFGKLYKIKFKIIGKVHPGASEILIKWKDGQVNAKWDENQNPLRLLSDGSEEFVPEKVPDTRILGVYCRREYMVPILHEDSSGQLTIFSGWWFGRNAGYGIDVPTVFKDQKIQIEFVSQNLSKSIGQYYIGDIICDTKSLKY